MTTRQENPDTVCGTKDMALQQIAQINTLLTEADRVEMRKSFGLWEDYNPLLYIPADFYLSIPVEVLHTLSLGSCKHFLKDVHVMPKMSPHQKREMQARVRAINMSGFSTKLHGSVCYYYQSFALFNLGPYLSDGQKEVLIAFSKVFRIAYCDFFKPALLDEWKSVCQAFVSAVKQHMPSLLEKQKTHLILHLVDSMVKFGPCSSFSAERFESFNSNVRMYNVFGNRLAPSRDIAKQFSALCNTYVTFVMVEMLVKGRLSILLFIIFEYLVIMFSVACSMILSWAGGVDCCGEAGGVDCCGEAGGVDCCGEAGGVDCCGEAGGVDCCGEADGVDCCGEMEAGGAEKLDS
eukprot:Em0007g513a